MHTYMISFLGKILPGLYSLVDATQEAQSVADHYNSRVAVRSQDDEYLLYVYPTPTVVVK